MTGRREMICVPGVGQRQDQSLARLNAPRRNFNAPVASGRSPGRHDGQVTTVEVGDEGRRETQGPDGSADRRHPNGCRAGSPPPSCASGRFAESSLLSPVVSERVA